MLPNMLPEVLGGLGRRAERHQHRCDSDALGGEAGRRGHGHAATHRRAARGAPYRRGGLRRLLHRAAHRHRVTWTTDPDENETHVQLHLTKIDLDVLGDDEDTLKILAAAGWVIDE